MYHSSEEGEYDETLDISGSSEQLSKNSSCSKQLDENYDSFFMNILTAYIKPEKTKKIGQNKDIQTFEVTFRRNEKKFLNNFQAMFR